VSRWSVALIAVALLLTTTLAAAGKKYGTALTLKEPTKISSIYANPEAFNGKRVQVKGAVVDVCEMRGCWIAIASDAEFQALRFKVDDGVITFPMSAKGLTAIAEGVVSVSTLTEQEQIEQGEHMAKEKGTTFDRSKVKGPKTSVMLKGEGAEVF
jgi:hypothetical protein